MSNNIIKLEKYERDCGHNRTVNLRRAHAKEMNDQKKVGRLIYDYRVVINGEVRAILATRFRSKGYDLREPIEDEWHPLKLNDRFLSAIKIESMGVALYSIEKLLENGLIPTVEQLQKRAAERDDEATKKRKEERRIKLSHQISSNAPKLLKLAKELARKLIEVGEGHPDSPCTILAVDALLKIKDIETL